MRSLQLLCETLVEQRHEVQPAPMLPPPHRISLRRRVCTANAAVDALCLETLHRKLDNIASASEQARCVESFAAWVSSLLVQLVHLDRTPDAVATRLGMHPVLRQMHGYAAHDRRDA